MGFGYGLAVVLVLFGGIIIQCEGGATTSSDRRRDAPILPNDIIELILSKTDFQTIHDTIQEKIIRTTDIAMSGILQNRIIVIEPHMFDGQIDEYYYDGDFILRMCNYQKLLKFFKRFGDHVKRIAICYTFTGENVPQNEINENIIKKYAKNFEELRIITKNDGGFWKEISEGENYIIFPEVKKLQMRIDTSRTKIELNLLFPKLEFLKLVGGFLYENCLENVKGLKELMLCTDLVNEQQLDGIFANNKNLTMIRLTRPNRAEIIQSVAKHLTKLKTLEVISPGVNFLSRANNNPVYELLSVNHFIFVFYGMSADIGMVDLHLSFDMPHLRKLTLAGSQADDRIINFINYFKELEIVEVLVRTNNAVECIGKLKRIKEFTITFCEHDFDSLKNLFENFDKESKLQTLKFVDVRESLYQKYEKVMKKLNSHLENSMKPTWTLSRGEQIGTGKKYLMFRREPCKCKSCKK